MSTSIELEEEIEGDQIGSKNYRFSKIGTPVPLKPDESSSFDLENQSPPLQPLVVSERFRLLFIAHSDGFCVARTKEVMASAQEIKEKGSGPSIQELSVVDVTIGKVSVLALSGDDSLLAACVGNKIHFFPVSALLYKDQTPAFSHSVKDSSVITDMQWAKKAEKVYVVLSSDGKLYSGVGQRPIKEVMDDVDAVGWSPDGEFIAVTRKNLISILSSKFEEKFSISLAFKSLLDDSNAKCIIKVDAVRWIRPDCIIIGCLQVNDDDEEENYAVQVITSENGGITNPSAKPVVRSFRDVFLDFRYDAVPLCSGCHLFLSYLDQHQLAFVANRKNLDQHILLFGWSVGDEKNEAATIEILNDNWSPKIEAQDSGDDILILGLAIDKVSQNGEVKLLLGEEEKEVSPCCLLLCLTNDGRVSIFHFASATAASAPPHSTDSDEKNDASIVASSQDVLVESSSARKQINQVDSGLQPHEDRGHKIVATDALSSAAVKFSSEEAIKTRNQNQGAKLEQSTSKTSIHVDAGRVSNFRTQETQKVAEVKPGAKNFSGNSLGNFAIPSIGQSTGTGSVMELPGKIVSTGSSTASSLSSELRISSKLDERPSSTPFSGVQSKTFDFSDRNSSGSNETAGTSVSIDSFKQRALAGAGNIESLPAFPGSRLPSQKGFVSEPLKPHLTRETCEGIPSKQFRDVEEMARKLDSLLEGIEGEGGFRDASIRAHRSSVLALEEGIESVSEKCRIWRGVMDEQLGEIQLLLDKTVQVLARKVYMEGIFKQATDERYWDLWNRQKLNSELELKRQHIKEVNKSLTSQLIELERHFNTLELNKFGDTSGIQTSKRGFQSRPGQPRHVQSLHSLRNTMTTQLAVAEQLSESLSKLMTDLSIDSPAKGQNVRKKLFETIGLSYDGASYNSPVGEKAVDTPFNKELSAFLAVKERSRRKQTSPVKSAEPETARRRRDSLDRNWASFEPPKTTVKRIVLQEDRQKDIANRSSLSLDKKHHHSQMRERSATAQSNIFNASSTSSQQLKSKGLHDMPAKQSTENPFFQWADGLPRHAAEMPPMSSPVSLLQRESQSIAVTSQYCSVDTHNLAKERSGSSTIPLRDTVQTGGLKAIQQSENRMQQPNSSNPPAQTCTPIKFSIETSNAVDKPGITKPTIRDWKNAAVTSESTQFESSSSPNYSLSTAAAADSPFTLSAKVIHSEVVNASQVTENPFSSQASTWSSSSQVKITPSASASSSQEPMFSPISSTSFESISKANMGSSQKVSQSQSSAASMTQSSSLLSTQKLDSLLITPPSDGTKSESPTGSSLPSVAILDTKADKNSDRPASIANLSTKMDTPQDSASQPPVSVSVSNLQTGPSVQSKSTNEQSASLNSANQISSGGTSSEVLDVGLNTTPGQPFSASAISPPIATSSTGSAINVKSGSSDVVNHEDEMEEEAPESSQMTENPLGNLAGFGIGTAATPVTAKPNPFGAVSPSKASSPANSLFTSTASGGELFRPASFSFQPIQPPQPSASANFGAFPGSFSLSSTSQAPAMGGFGQPAQIGQGQQALGSVLGTFGQSRQIGAGLPGTGAASASSFGRGFVSNNSAGGFGGGFSGVSSTGGGFASLASGGGGFTAAAAPGGGFAAAAAPGGGFGAAAAAAAPGGGFAAAATSAGGFAAAATSAGGFAVAATAGVGFAAPTAVGSGFSGGGFGAFSSQQSGGGGFPAFGGSSATARPPSELFTQMRK